MRCLYCGAHNVWDRVRYLNERGELTTYPAAKAYVESVVCLSCKEPQPLGPSNDDTGPHAASVACELRGTMLADNWREQSYKPGADRFEWCPETKSDELCDLCQAHVLAHDIATHTEES